MPRSTGVRKLSRKSSKFQSFRSPLEHERAESARSVTPDINTGGAPVQTDRVQNFRQSRELVDQKSPAFGKRCPATISPFQGEEKRRAPEISSFLPGFGQLDLYARQKTAANHAISSAAFSFFFSTHTLGLGLVILNHKVCSTRRTDRTVCFEIELNVLRRISVSKFSLEFRLGEAVCLYKLNYFLI